jgi:hypothetical protein
MGPRESRSFGVAPVPNSGRLTVGPVGGPRSLEPRLNKKTRSEADICAKYITSALIGAGWSEVEQVFREYTLRPGRVVVQGSQSRRDKRSVLRAD